MKKYIEETWSTYVLSFIVAFMLFIFEPLLLYSSNITDFWYDFRTLLSESIYIFFILFIISIIILNLFYFLFKKIYNEYYILKLYFFICAYIQGNYLCGNLPLLDGNIINWNLYKTDMIISLILDIIVFIIIILINKKIKYNKFFKYSGYVLLVIFAMLSVSLITTLIQNKTIKLEKDKYIAIATPKNINKYSTEDNFIIFLIDGADSQMFDKAVKNNPELASALNDFTYYPDTLSYHPFTRESLPLILTNKIYNNGDFTSFNIKAMKESRLLNTLYAENYEVNLYEYELNYNDESASKIANVTNFAKEKDKCVDNIKFTLEQMKYNIFKYAPYYLKKSTSVGDLDFYKVTNNCGVQFDFHTEVFPTYLKQKVEKEDTNNFKFIHISGAHVPFQFDKDMNIGITTYYDEIEGCLNITNQYINYLKENDIYNNSRIIILADHGFLKEDFSPEGRFNPILYIKGKNEWHDEMYVSDKKISFIDLADAYDELLEGKKSTELFENITNERKRLLLQYDYHNNKNMIEYETEGNAWDYKNYKKTGKEYNIK